MMQTEFTILWRDESLVVIHKPAGWLVHRTGLDAGETRFVLQTLRDQLGQLVWPVHRLDKGTSGVLVMALNAETARVLSDQWHTVDTVKRYVAIVRGWAPLTWTVDHPLVPDDAPKGSPAQPAVTHFQRLATLTLPVPVDRYPTTRASLIEAKLETGRRHQIRRHLKHSSHPIIGDATHGKGTHNRWWAEQLGLNRLWLHAHTLAFRHPHTGEAIAVSSPWREPTAVNPSLNHDWQAWLNQDAWPWLWDH